MTSREILYWSTVKGLANKDGGPATVFYGKVHKIPREDFSTQRHLNHEKMLEEIIEEIRNSRPDLDPSLFGPIERYEIFEVGTGDVFVMYRIPCRKAIHN